jgi:phosphate transport system substrate-binding protein
LRIDATPADGYVAVVGEESIVLIVNANNPVSTIGPEKLQDLFTGRLKTWAEVGGKPEPVQVWAYLDGDDIRSVFDAVIFPGEKITSQALLAPNPQVMLEAVADDPQAIGYVPQIWLDQSDDKTRVRALNLNIYLANNLRQPLLALTRSEPVGSLRELLVCIQSAGK